MQPRSTVVLWMVFVPFDVAALGQGSTGRISGTLFDSSGAAVVGATIDREHGVSRLVATQVYSHDSELHRIEIAQGTTNGPACS